MCDLPQVGSFLRVLWFPPPIRWPPRYGWNIFESSVKHHNPNTPQFYLFSNMFSGHNVLKTNIKIWQFSSSIQNGYRTILQRMTRCTFDIIHDSLISNHKTYIVLNMWFDMSWICLDFRIENNDWHLIRERSRQNSLFSS